MKLIQYIFICILFLVGGNTSAQTFKAGFGGGLVVSDIDGADTRDTDNDFHKIGFTIGGVVNTRIAKRTLLQFELNYISKGSLQPPDSLNNGYYKIALGYIEIPVLIRQQIYFNWKGKKINKIDLEAGVSYGKMVQRQVVGSSNYTLNNTAQYYNTNDVSVLVGADYNFTRNVCFCFRYSNSVIPAIKRNAIRPGFASYSFNKGNNLVFQFSFKFLFGGKEKAVAPAPEVQTP